jgi:hypothetical protein
MNNISAVLAALARGLVGLGALAGGVPADLVVEAER